MRMRNPVRTTGPPGEVPVTLYDFIPERSILLRSAVPRPTSPSPNPTPRRSSGRPRGPSFPAACRRR
jgi:hypothetical protein